MGMHIGLEIGTGEGRIQECSLAYEPRGRTENVHGASEGMGIGICAEIGLVTPYVALMETWRSNRLAGIQMKRVGKTDL